jgi:hypothetical protein
MKNALFLIIGVTIGSLGAANLFASPKEPVVQVKAETIIGHRIGPAGQEMLLVK